MRTDDWTGEEFDGAGYVFTTTDGREVVAAERFRGALGRIDTLATLLDDVSERVAALENPEPAAAQTATAARKTTSKATSAQ